MSDMLARPRGTRLKRLALALSLLVAVAAPGIASAQLKKEAQALRNFSEELDEAAKAPDFVGLDDWRRGIDMLRD